MEDSVSLNSSREAATLRELDWGTEEAGFEMDSEAREEEEEEADNMAAFERGRAGNGAREGDIEEP